MRRVRTLVCCGFVLASALPAAAAGPPQPILTGQAFRIAGTRVGCAVHGASSAPRVICGLWGRTTRSLQGTMSIAVDEQEVEVFQRPLVGPPSLLYALPQPATEPPRTLPPPLGRSRTRTLSYGEVADLLGTDISCAVVLREQALGVRCGRIDQTTRQFVAASAVAILTEQNAFAARVNPKGVASTVFYQRQPYIPSRAVAARERRELRRASRRLAALRRLYHGSRRGYLTALAGFDAIDDELGAERYLSACLKFTPLLYNGFYLPPRSVSYGPGHRYLARVERIERGLCS